MICAYSELYLQDAMQNLGEMTEYAHDACGADLEKVFRCFTICGLAERFEKGDPLVVSGMSGTELYRRIIYECGERDKKWPAPLVRYETREYYWIGYILAYYQWRSGRHFKEILDSVPIDKLLKLYPALHTTSEKHAYELLDGCFKENSLVSRVQRYRKCIGITQAELARRTGVNLRTLQQYEIGDKDIRKASVQSVLALSRTLCCQPENLL
ncbi:MAG: helix-turn-helix transcriptional regulator [Clostridiales bacterium]|nr:helix-turn-helix transcriptional regulator [Clostridiales bacterium]